MMQTETTSLLSNRAGSSIAQDPEVSVVDFDTESSLPLRRGRRNGKFRKSYLILTALSVLMLITTVRLMPTTDEMDLMEDNNLSFLSLGRLRRAQLLADKVASKDFLNKFVEDISKKDHKQSSIKKRQDYVEPPEGCEATIMLVRHCEKRSIREHCAVNGFERSVYLATLFGEESSARWPTPSYLFAESPGDRHNHKKLNFREVETIGPLAEKSGLEIDDSYSPHTANQLTRQLLTLVQMGQMCGKVAVLSWKHSDIGHLARHLGCGPSQGCPLDYKGNRFDDVWQIKFVYQTIQHSSRKSLALPPEKPQWRIYGSVQQQGFDPLAFSKMVGDYPKGGTAKGGRWRKSAVNIPERKKASDDKSWEHQVPGLLGVSKDFVDLERSGQKENRGKK